MFAAFEEIKQRLSELHTELHPSDLFSNLYLQTHYGGTEWWRSISFFNYRVVFITTKHVLLVYPT